MNCPRTYLADRYHRLSPNEIHNAALATFDAAPWTMTPWDYHAPTTPGWILAAIEEASPKAIACVWQWSSELPGCPLTGWAVVIEVSRREASYAVYIYGEHEVTTFTPCWMARNPIGMRVAVRTIVCGPAGTGA